MKLCCPACRKRLKARRKLLGRRVKCPGCEARFRVGGSTVERSALQLFDRLWSRSKN